MEGDYQCSTRGKSVFYFDIERRLFVSGKIAMVMQISANTPMPEMKFKGGHPPDTPKRYNMSMMSDNFIQVKLK